MGTSIVFHCNVILTCCKDERMVSVTSVRPVKLRYKRGGEGQHKRRVG